MASWWQIKFPFQATESWKEKSQMTYQPVRGKLQLSMKKMEKTKSYLMIRQKEAEGF